MGEKEGFKEVAIEPLRQFAKDSMHLVKKCTKPDRKEFTTIAKAVGVGFSIMGFIGFFVKLVHIPINNILVGVGSSFHLLLVGVQNCIHDGYRCTGTG
eukprot:scaffold1521_cov271-Chaetoceros_neogracile.AAC.97